MTDDEDDTVPHPTYITLVNLLTAQADRMPRIGVLADAIAASGRDLDRALAATDEVAILAPTPGSALKATGNGRALLATLFVGPVPMLSWGVPRRATAGPKLWAVMTDDQPSQAERPAWPWIAWRGHVPHGEAWMINYAYCLALAFIEGQAGG